MLSTEMPMHFMWYGIGFQRNSDEIFFGMFHSFGYGGGDLCCFAFSNAAAIGALVRTKTGPM